MSALGEAMPSRAPKGRRRASVGGRRAGDGTTRWSKEAET